MAFAAAMDEAAEAGFLLAAGRVLHRLGLVPGEGEAALPAAADTSGGQARDATPGGADHRRSSAYERPLRRHRHCPRTLLNSENSHYPT